MASMAAVIIVRERKNLSLSDLQYTIVLLMGSSNLPGFILQRTGVSFDSSETFASKGFTYNIVFILGGKMYK